MSNQNALTLENSLKYNEFILDMTISMVKMSEQVLKMSNQLSYYALAFYLLISSTAFEFRKPTYISFKF